MADSEDFEANGEQTTEPESAPAEEENKSAKSLGGGYLGSASL